jgi:hypothetical protein
VPLSLICSGMTRLRALVPWGFLFLTRSEPHKDQINGARKMISDSSFLLLIVAWHEKLLAQLNHGSFYVEYNFKVCCVFSFAFTPCLKRIVLKSDSVWWSIWNLELKSSRIEKKTGKEKTWSDPADLTGWLDKTWSKTQLQPVDFFFFLLKQCRFDFFKKIDPNDPVKPETQALNRVESKNYAKELEKWI